MSDIRPFPGLRPRPDLVAEIAAPPYDVVTRMEAKALIQRQPHSFMRVIRPDVELEDGVDRLDARVFAAGQKHFRALLAEGLLVRDEVASLYLYELTMNDHVQIGVVAGASLDEYERGLIKRHEKTREMELEGRTHHIEALAANTGPVFMTYPASAAIDTLAARLTSQPALYTFVAEDGVQHRFWKISDAGDIAGLQRAFADVPALYIADGHHRTAASAQVRKLRRQQPGAPREEQAYDHFLTVMFPHDQLKILPYNRVVLDRGELSTEALLAAVEDRFMVEPAEAAEPSKSRTFGMYVAGKWYRLTARPGSYPEDDPERSLDVSILQENLLAPVLGIEHPRRDPRIKFIGGIRGIGELERRADASNGVAFCLFPVAIEEVMAIADAGGVMPPKSTWFEPKLRSGVIVRAIEPST